MLENGIPGELLAVVEFKLPFAGDPGLGEKVPVLGELLGSTIAKPVCVTSPRRLLPDDGFGAA